MQNYLNENTLEVGLDEAGRGPLFGRVYVAAVILPPEDFNHEIMRDSKNYRREKDLSHSIILKIMR